MKTREHRARPAGDATEEQVRHAAYYLWQQEGCPSGRELDHWLAAKEMIKHRRHLPPVAREEEPSGLATERSEP